MSPIQALENAKMDESIAVAWLKYKREFKLDIDPMAERLLFRVFQSGFMLGGLEMMKQVQEIVR